MVTVYSNLSIFKACDLWLWRTQELGFPHINHGCPPRPLIDISLNRRKKTSMLLSPVAAINTAEYRRLKFQNSKFDPSNDEEQEDDLCPVDCVKEFRTEAELLDIIEASKKNNTLVVVDFYKTACGSCKYVEHGFAKLCKAAGDHEDAVIFLKHNVVDEYEEQSEVAERLRIKVVPQFHFYKGGELVEKFATREKNRILETIQKYLVAKDSESNDG